MVAMSSRQCDGGSVLIVYLLPDNLNHVIGNVTTKVLHIETLRVCTCTFLTKNTRLKGKEIIPNVLATYNF